MTKDQTSSYTVRALRRRWKPTKERLAEQRGEHPTNVRIHRACNWLQQVEALDGADPDMMLVCQLYYYPKTGRVVKVDSIPNRRRN